MYCLGLARIELHLPACHSLKEKRALLNHLKEHLRRRNLSVSETGHQDEWQRTAIALALVGHGEDAVRRFLAEAVEIAASQDGAMLIAEAIDVHPLGNGESEQ